MSEPRTIDPGHVSTASNDDMVQRIGQLARMLRDSMRELGLDKEVERAAEAIPDARDRLSYIATMTEQAAERSLNAIDRAQPLQDLMSERANALQQRWTTCQETLPLVQGSTEVARLIHDTQTYLAEVPEHTQATRQELLEILMAQDFQDLTGQVIKRMMDVIREIEQQLVQVLLDNVPAGEARENRRQKAQERDQGLLNGPQIDTSHADVMANQDQVDDLLDELGF